MGLKDSFQIPERVRQKFVNENILAHLPVGSRAEAAMSIEALVVGYAGRDRDALSVLAYASERGRLEEYIGKLRDHLERSLKYVHPDARTNPNMPGAVHADRFFLDCYNALGIQPADS